MRDQFLAGRRNVVYAFPALAAGCDAYVTSGIRHHEFVDSRARGLTLLDAGHAQTETPGARELGRRLEAALPEAAVVFV